MVHDFVNIPLSDFVKRASFGKNAANIFVALFNARLLPSTHRIAVVNAGVNDVIDACLKSIRIRELSTSVRNDTLK